MCILIYSSRRNRKKIENNNYLETIKNKTSMVEVEINEIIATTTIKNNIK